MGGEITRSRVGTAIVGAGMAGLTAARVLADAQLPVRVFDKGRSVGGRLATRRIGAARLDHGAQFFTVRSEEFAAVVGEARQAGVVHEWSRGFASTDGHPRYAVRGGMNRLAKHLAAGLDIEVDAEITSISIRDGGWILRHGNVEVEAGAVVMTAPVPQGLALLDAGGVTLDDGLVSRLADVAYHPTLALLVVLDGPPAIDAPGGVQLSEGPFGFIGDNRAKGASDQPAVTFHASHDFSRQAWDAEFDDVRDELLGLARPWIGGAQVAAAQLKRWRYAQPVAPADHLVEETDVDGAPLVFAGDAFAGAKVEGAFLSGRAAGLALRDRLANR